MANEKPTEEQIEELQRKLQIVEDALFVFQREQCGGELIDVFDAELARMQAELHEIMREAVEEDQPTMPAIQSQSQPEGS